RPHRLQEGACDRRVDPGAARRPAGLAPVMGVDRVALREGDRPAIGVADGHPAAAPPAPDGPLEQGGALARRTAAVLGPRRPVLVELLLIPPGLLPGDVPGAVPGDEERPVLGPDPAGPALDPRALAGQGLGAGLGAAVDVGAGGPGVVKDGRDPAVAR